jgi:hypothetical protein
MSVWGKGNLSYNLIILGPRGIDCEHWGNCEKGSKYQVKMDEMKFKGKTFIQREIGSDVAEGELLLEKGTLIGPAEIGLVALSGKEKVGENWNEMIGLCLFRFWFTVSQKCQSFQPAMNWLTFMEPIKIMRSHQLRP